MTKFNRGDKVRLKQGESKGTFNDPKMIAYYLGTHEKVDEKFCQLQIPGFDGHSGIGGRFCDSVFSPVPGVATSGNDRLNVPIDILELVDEAPKKNDFKIGDEVKIDWPGYECNGKIGTIVKIDDDDRIAIKIPDFNGYDGGIPDGTTDKWYFHFSNLSLISRPSQSKLSETKSETIKEAPKMGITQTKEKEKQMFDFNYKEIFQKNKELAIQEGQRQAGKIVFEHLFELPIIQNLPESIKTFLKTPIGKFLIANLVKTVSTFYTGPNQDKIEFITDSLLRGALSDLGDSFNINKIFSDLTSKISHLIPGDSKE